MSFTTVVKRDGQKVNFEVEKIVAAINKAAQVTKEFDKNIAESLSRIVFHNLNMKQYVSQSDEIYIEDIQDVVEDVLFNSVYKKTAKAYAIYRDQRARTREITTAFHIDLVDKYVEKEDWKVKENSNTTFSIQGLHHYMSNEISSQYWLNKIYPKEIRDAHNSGDYHIHDLGMLATYCCGWSLEDILLKGFTGVSGKISSTPPKHFRTALGQLVNFLFTLQGESSGAVAVSNFDTLLAPFVRYDNLTYEQVRQSLQEFVFNMNISTRVGFQAPFSNITLDLQVPSTHTNMPVIVNGQYKEETYSEFQEEMNMINKAFVEVMIAGDASGRIFTFPIPTYNIDNNFDWNNSNYDPIFQVAGKYGIQYFANFCGSDMSPEDARSMCPLHGDTLVKIKYNGKEVVEKISESFLRDTSKGQTLEIPYKNSWKKASVIYVKPESFVEVELDETRIVCFEGRHEQLVTNRKREERVITAKEITKEDYLPIFTGKDESKTWMSVRDIKIRKPEEKETSYCFVVETDKEEERYFHIANGIITHNCRLRIDNRELRKRGGGLFGSSPLTGSLNVITINLPRIGYLSKSEDDFIEKLNDLLDLAKEAHIIKRKVINDFTDKGMYPYTSFYLQDVKKRTGSCWSNHFNTVGVIGMDDACQNLFGCSIGEEKGKDFALRVMNHVRDRLIEFQEETGLLFNLEATPGEGCSYSLALKDKKKYPNILTKVGECGTPFYTNSTHLPVNYTDDMFELLDLQDELQTKYTGGTVIHFFLGEEITDVKVVKSLVRKICENYKLPYFSLTPTFSTCDNHGYLPGKQESCPTCGSETEIFSRVVGYYRPIKSWNAGKVAEFNMRKTFGVQS